MGLKLVHLYRAGLSLALLAVIFPNTGCSGCGRSKADAAAAAPSAPTSESPSPAPSPSVSPSLIAAPTISVINANSSEIWLAWESPEGATSFDFKIANSSFADETLVNATAATASPPPTPTAAGEFQMTAITGLTSDLAYYLGIRAVGDAGILSTLSNIANATTGFGMAGFLGWGRDGWQMGTQREVMPSFVHVTSTGDILATDRAGNRVVKFNSSGKFIAWTGGGSNGWQTSFAAAKAGTELGYFAMPAGLSTDTSGNIYVADAYNHRVVKIASDGTFVGWIGNGQNGWQTGTAPSTFANGDSYFKLSTAISGLAVGPDNILYVVDTGNARVQKWSLTGTFLGWYGKGTSAGNVVTSGWHAPGSGDTPGTGTSDQQFNSPRSVAFDSFGSMYVTDLINSRVHKFTKTATDATLGSIYGTYEGWIGSGLSGWNNSVKTPGITSSLGTGDAYFVYPQGITVDRAGNIYVSDISNYRVTKWNSAGIFQGWLGRGATTTGWHDTGSGQIGYAGSADEEYLLPISVAIDASDNFFVSDYYTGFVTKYSSSSQFLGTVNGVVSTWTTGNLAFSGIESGKLYTPRHVTLDSSGNLYISEWYGNRVSKYQSDGTFVGWIGGGLSGWQTTARAPTSAATNGNFNYPMGLAVAANGDIYVADYNNNRIQVWNSDGVFQSNIAVAGPNDVKLEVSSGTTYVWVTIANYIKKLGTDGSVITTIGGSGSGDGKISSNPRSIDFDNSGNIYLADASNSRVAKWNSATPAIFQGWIGKGGTTSGWHDSNSGQTGTAGFGPSEFNPSIYLSLCVDRTHQLLYVLDWSGRIQKFGLDGTFIGWHGNGTPGWQTTGTAAQSSSGLNDQFGYGGLAVDSSGTLYLADINSGRILKFK